MQSARKLFFFVFIGFILTNLSGSGLFLEAFAEGTRSWEQSKFDELTKGTATGVAIRSTGGLELAPTFRSLYATPSTYIWAIAPDESNERLLDEAHFIALPAHIWVLSHDQIETIK